PAGGQRAAQGKARRVEAVDSYRLSGEADVMPAAPDADTDRLLALAISQHRAGHIAEAERIYRQILTSDPGHADSLHLLGIVAYQRADHERAVDLIQRAIAAKSFAPFHYN